jgi:signal peptidase II
MNGRISKWTLLSVVASVWLVADQVTKYLAVEHLTQAFAVARAHTLPEKISAFVEQKDLLERGLANRTPATVTSFWENRYAQNRGSAFGLLANAPEGFRVPFFHVLTVVALIFVFNYYRKLKGDQRYIQFAMALVLAGVLGNELDRILRGYVIDFIGWHWFDPEWLRPNLHWPNFNVADSGLSIGLVLLLFEGLVKKPEAAASKKGRAASKA